MRSRLRSGAGGLPERGRGSYKGAMKPLFGIALVIFFEVVSFSAVFPVLHRYCLELGGNEHWVGLLFFLVPAPKFVMAPIWGWLSDRWGRRPVLAMITVGTLAAAVVWGMSSTLAVLALSRLMAGIFGAQAVLAYAVAADVSAPEKRAASMGVLGAAFGLGMTVGPALGGYTGRFSLPAVGYLCAAFELCSLVVIVLLFRETRPREARRSGLRRFALNPLKGLGGHPRAVPYLWVLALVTAALSLMIPSFGVVAERWWRFDETQTGNAWALFGLVGVLVQGGLVRPAVRRLGERTTGVAGMLTLVAGFGLLALHPPVAGLWTATVLIAAGSSLASPALTALLSHCVGRGEQGWLMGVNQGLTGLARAAGMGLSGVLMAVALPAPYVLAAVTTLLAAGVLWSARTIPAGGADETEAISI